MLASESQFAHPALHEATVHADALHPAVACARLHVIPQPPHAVTVLVVSVSQPLLSVLSQLPHPVLHEPIAHDPVEHVGVAWARVHVTPHAPQSLTVLSEASQPVE